MTLTRFAITAGLVLAMAGPVAAQHSRRGGGGGGQARAAAPQAPRGPVAVPRQAPPPRSYSSGPRTYAPPPVVNGRGGPYAGPRSVAPYRAPGNYGYAGPRSNGYYHGGGAWRGYYPNNGHYGYGHGHGYGYGYGYWRPYPYYSFHPHFSIGFGLYLGYPVPYPYLYSYPYPVPYPVPYPAYPSYPSYPAPGPYPYGTAPQQYPPSGYSNPYPDQYQQGYQDNSVNVEPGVTGGLSFDIQPSSAEVMVDGQNYGQVGNYSPNAQQPLALAPGRHRVEIRQPGYRNIAFDVDIVAGQVLPYQGTLQAN